MTDPTERKIKMGDFVRTKPMRVLDVGDGVARCKGPYPYSRLMDTKNLEAVPPDPKALIEKLEKALQWSPHWAADDCECAACKDTADARAAYEQWLKENG